MNSEQTTRPMNHEERMRLIMKPFPEVRRLPCSARWAGILTYPHGFERSLQPGVKTGWGNQQYGRIHARDDE